MKEQDLIQALGSLPQDMLDELDEWQKSGAPLTGAEPENNAPARTVKPVITQRRNRTMKQKTEKTPARLRAWTAGIAAAVVLCMAAAVPVGREAVRRAQQSNAGFAESEGQSVAELAEQAAQHDPVPLLEELICFGGNDTESPAVPDEGDVKVLRSMADLQPLIDETDRGYMEMEAAEWYSQYGMNEALFETNDVLYFAFKDWQLPEHYYNFEFTGGSITAADSLTLNFSAFILDDPPVDFIRCVNTCSNYYYFYTVPKDSLPDISNVHVDFAETHYGDLPDNVLLSFEESSHDDLISVKGLHNIKEYLDTTQEYPAWVNSIPAQLSITWDYAEPAQPEKEILTAEQPDNSQSPDDAFYAWFWTGYSGNDIPLDGITVDVIRTAADGKPYLTGSGQQDQSTLATVLSEEWLEQAYPESEAITDPVSGRQINSDGQPHDVIFIGIPADALPRNAVTQNYHSGTLTPSGKLHIDITALTLLDEAMPLLPEERQFDENLNRYFFITVPAGELPETIEPTVSITEYHTDLMPPESLATPQAVWDWYIQRPAGQSWLASVVGNKFIHRIPDEPETVPVQYAYSCLLTETEKIETEPGKDAFCDYDSETGKIGLTLPVHNAAAAAALTDLHISADGVLSLTLNEFCRSGSDLTQDTAYITWDLYVPKGSLPEITDIRLDRNTLSDAEAFMDIADQLITITKE